MGIRVQFYRLACKRSQMSVDIDVSLRFPLSTLDIEFRGNHRRLMTPSCSKLTLPGWCTGPDRETDDESMDSCVTSADSVPPPEWTEAPSAAAEPRGGAPLGAERWRTVWPGLKHDTAMILHQNKRLYAVNADKGKIGIFSQALDNIEVRYQPAIPTLI